MTTDTSPGGDGRPDRRTSRARDPHPRIGGWRVTDLSAALGVAVVLALLSTQDWQGNVVEEVELFVALALLVLVPLGLGVVATDSWTGEPPLSYRFAVYAQFPGALAAAAALAQPVGSTVSVALVLPWLAVTGAIASVGAFRILGRLGEQGILQDLRTLPREPRMLPRVLRRLPRGLRPLPELAIDAALLYLPVGAVALSLHRGDVSLQFTRFIVLLTAVHYHYAGFALPLVTGRIGRIVAGDDGHFGADRVGRIVAVATVVIVVNLALIAVGITFSPTVEIVAVALFTVAVVVLSVVVVLEVVPGVGRAPGALLALGALTMLWTMALALAYAYSAFPTTGTLIAIDEMVTWHGRLNALAFAIPGLLAFRLLDR